MNVLYPEIEPFATDILELDNGHSIYFEQSGNIKGLPVIFLHGGPGSGCNENHRRYFDPEKYRIIIFDQRGCHRSKPNGCIENNTTQKLLADIDSIRHQLNIEKLVLFGGSWGATLALLYAEEYPQHVAAMVLRGTFLARQSDFDWFASDDINGVNRIFPDYWQEFLSIFNEAERDHCSEALHQRVFSDKKEIQLEAAKAWSLWAGRVVTHSLNLDEPYVLDEEDDEKLIDDVKIEINYAKNKYFVKQNQILDNLAAVPDVPITIVHGRKDLTCLPEASWSVQQALMNSNMTKSKLVMVADGLRASLIIGAGQVAFAIDHNQ